MKICHGAGLALTGWYLMVPPAFSHSRDRVTVVAGDDHYTFESKRASEAERGHFSKVDPGAEAYGHRGLPPEEVYDAQCRYRGSAPQTMKVA
jgi:hypothetical protein